MRTTPGATAPRTTARTMALAVIVLALALAGEAFASPVRAQAAPAAEATASATWRQVTTGSNFSCAIATTGRLYCWGFDTEGQLGNGPSVVGTKRRPTEVAGRRTDWVAVEAGATSVCARRASGRLFCWGNDTQG